MVLNDVEIATKLADAMGWTHDEEEREWKSPDRRVTYGYRINIGLTLSWGLVCHGLEWAQERFGPISLDKQSIQGSISHLTWFGNREQAYIETIPGKNYYEGFFHLTKRRIALAILKAVDHAGD